MSSETSHTIHQGGKTLDQATMSHYEYLDPLVSNVYQDNKDLSSQLVQT